MCVYVRVCVKKSHTCPDCVCCVQRNVYWATTVGEELAEELTKRITQCRSTDGGHRQKWDESLRLFYGQDAFGGTASSDHIGFAGDQDEYLSFRVNHMRSLVQNMHTLVTGTLMNLRAKAASADSVMMERAEFADQLLQYYMRHKSIERSLSRAALYAILLGEGWVHVSWDTGQGDLYVADPETGAEYRTGDIRVTPVRPDQVLRDPTRDPQGTSTHEWVVVEQQVNRYELHARFPELADTIEGLSQHRMSEDGEQAAFDLGGPVDEGLDLGDYVYVYHFYHDRTPACPDGKYALLIGEEVAITHGLPYNAFPVISMVPDQLEGSAYGYAHASDMMAVQSLYDGVMSATATGIESSGMPVWWFHEGDSVVDKDLEAGSIVSTQTEPQIKQFVYNPGPNMQFLDLLRREMELTSGVNSVVRGNPEKGIQDNAKAMMFVHAQAFQRLNDIHRSYVKLTEETASCVLQILAQYATTERVAELTGESGLAARRVWTGADLDGVSQVEIEITNPVHQSVAGRVAMADKFVELGWVKGPHDYTRVLTTGRLEPVTRQYRNQHRLIAEENRRLREGGHVPVLVTDNHLTHIPDHLAVLDDLDVRLDDSKSAATLNHLMEHFQHLRDADDDVLATIDPRMIEIKQMVLDYSVGKMQAEQMAAPPPMPPPEAMGPEGGPMEEAALNDQIPVDGPQQVLPPEMPAPVPEIG